MMWRKGEDVGGHMADTKKAQWKGYATTPEAEKVAKFKGQKGSDVRRRERNVKGGGPSLMRIGQIHGHHDRRRRDRA